MADNLIGNQLIDDPSANLKPQGSSAWRRFRRHKLAVISAAILTTLLILVIFAPLVAPIHPHDIHIESGIYRPPSTDHWLGTDSVARDVWSRLIYGGRISITVGVIAITISLSIGTFIGGIAGYYGGLLDSVLMRITDVFLSLPTIIIVLASVALIGPSLRNLILIIGFLSWANIARLVRGQFLSLREK